MLGKRISHRLLTIYFWIYFWLCRLRTIKLENKRKIVILYDNIFSHFHLLIDSWWENTLVEKFKCYLLYTITSQNQKLINGFLSLLDFDSHNYQKFVTSFIITFEISNVTNIRNWLLVFHNFWNNYFHKHKKLVNFITFVMSNWKKDIKIWKTAKTYFQCVNLHDLYSMRQ